MENPSKERVVCGGKWITLQDIEEQYGKNRDDAAATFKVSPSTFRRRCKELGINKWPYPRRNSSRPNALIGENVLHSLSQSGSKNKIASTKESCSNNEATSQLLQMKETSSTPSHQRENQNSGIPIRQAIEGNNMPNSTIGHDVVDRMEAQSSLESVSAQQLNSVSSIEKTKSLFHKLINLSLEDLSNPENETSMREVLFILQDNHYLFSEEQAEQILQLYVKFPTLVLIWRECSRSQYSDKSSAETEEIRDLVKNSVRDEESLKVRNEELESQKKELTRELEEVQKEKAEIDEKMIQNSQQTMYLISKAEEKKALQKRLEGIATDKRNELSEKWLKQQSFFSET